MSSYFIANKHYPWNREIFDHSNHERPVENQKARGFSLFVDGVPYSRLNYATARDIPWKPVVIDTRLRGKAITFTVSSSTTPIPEELQEFYVPGFIKLAENDSIVIPEVVSTVAKILTPPVFTNSKEQIPLFSDKAPITTNKTNGGKLPKFRPSFQYPWTRELFKANMQRPPFQEDAYKNIQVSYMNGIFVPLLDVDTNKLEIWDYLSRLSLNGRVLFKVSTGGYSVPAELSNYYRLNDNRSVFLCKHAAYLIPHVEYRWTKEIRDRLRLASNAEGHPNIIVTSSGVQHVKHIAIKVDGVSVGSIKNESGITCPEINSWESLNRYLNEGKTVTFSTHNTSMLFRLSAMKLYSDVYGMPYAVQETVPEQFRRNNLQKLPLKLKDIELPKKTITQPVTHEIKSVQEKVDHSTRVLETKEKMVKTTADVITPEIILNGLNKTKERRFAYTPGLNYIWSKTAADIVAKPFVANLPATNELSVTKFLADSEGRRYITKVSKCGDWEQVSRSPSTNLMYHFTVSDSNIEVPKALISHFEVHYGYVFDEIVEEEFEYFYKPSTEYLWTPKLQKQLGLVGPFACEAHFGNVTVDFFGNDPSHSATATTSLIQWDKFPEDMMVVFTVKEAIKIDKNIEHIIVPELNELNLIKKSV